MKKKEITRKYLLKRVFIYYTVAYIGLFLPLIIYACINFNKYFVTNKDGISVAVGGIVMAIYFAVLIKVGIKRINGFLSATVFLLVIYCFNSIIKDMLPITLMFWLGVGVYTIFAIPGKHYKYQLNVWDNELIRSSAHEEFKKERGID